MRVILTFSGLIAALALAACAAAVGQGASKESSVNIVRAPDFPKGFAWLNTDRPLSLSGDLKGQVVLLDFWTYCCINCMHVLPELEALEERYKDQPVAIIGVHSAKYTTEEDPASIRAAVQRYGVHHPVVVDESHRIWDEYAVRAWPTLVLVGADGRIVGAVSGEGHVELLQQAIDKALADAKQAGTLAKGPLTLAREGTVRAASGLSFPGKVVADAAGRRLFVLDSNHNRIVVAGWPGTDGHCAVLDVIGSGTAGRADGDFAAAQFRRPQGACISGNVLWVADTENHLIRRIDLEKKRVVTVLGTGEQKFDSEPGKSGKSQPLNSPWDVALAGNRLYISEAGQHQLWAMNVMSGMAEVAAGSARENLLDGPAASAALAQPSGMALDAAGGRLYFADSETSSVRHFDLQQKSVHTLVGHGLFTFGDVDGPADRARLQHCIGVALSDDRQTVFVADSYNHKVKAVDVHSGAVRTIAGGKGVLSEPAGIAAAGGVLFVADTNNHRIVTMNPEGGAMKELVFDGLKAPGDEAVAAKVAIDAGTVTIGEEGLRVEATLALPAGATLTQGAPVSASVTDGKQTLFAGMVTMKSKDAMFEVPARALAGQPASVVVTVFYSYCEDARGVCVPAEKTWRLALGYSGPHTGTARLTATPAGD